MGKKIKRAGVLGAGVMGAAIAAHLANVGIETILLDIVPSLPKAAWTGHSSPNPPPFTCLRMPG